MSQRRKLNRLSKSIITIGVILAILTGLWQIDVVRQNVKLEWSVITGKAWKLQGRLSYPVINSSALGDSRRVIVYTPSGYNSILNANKRYPVMYMLHGAPGYPDDWVRYGRAPAEIEQMVIKSKCPEMIIVCPDISGIGTLGDSECIDAPGRPNAKNADVGTFIWRDVVAWTDSHYRTVHNANSRILAGVSTGGYGAVNMTLQHPDVFGSAFAFSGYYVATPYGWARPVWGKNPSPDRLLSESPLQYISDNKPEWKHLFIYIGEGMDEHPPYPQQSAAFADLLQKYGIPHVHKRMHGKHSWDLWRSLLKDAVNNKFGK